jgi:E3 ubiquitin-protein ligase UBR7
LDTIQYRQRTSNTNVYDDTFQGIHCYCQTKYNFDIQEQEMYQCYFCEDWFHDTCIGNMRNQDFEDFVCEQCLKNNDWLQIYSRDGVFCRADLFKDDCLLQCKPVEYKEFEPEVIDVESQVESITTGTANLLGLLLMYNWKDYICKCENCLKMYDEKAVSFVLVKDENVEPELDHKVDTFEEGIKELGRMDRIKALEGIRHFGKLKDGLTEYLKGFAGWFYLSLDSGKVVTEADILDYFQSLKRKRED